MLEDHPLCEKCSLVCQKHFGLPAERDDHQGILLTGPFQIAGIHAEGHAEAWLSHAKALGSVHSLRSFQCWALKNRVWWGHPLNKGRDITSVGT